MQMAKRHWTTIDTFNRASQKNARFELNKEDSMQAIFYKKVFAHDYKKSEISKRWQADFVQL